MKTKDTFYELQDVHNTNWSASQEEQGFLRALMQSELPVEEKSQPSQPLCGQRTLAGYSPLEVSKVTLSEKLSMTSIFKIASSGSPYAMLLFFTALINYHM